MSMTRKDFEAMAEVVAGLKGKADEPTRRQVAGELAALCERHNPQFDRFRFLVACGVERDEPTTKHVNDPSRWRR